MEKAEYRKHYNKGWRASGGTLYLDDAEERFAERHGVDLGSPEHNAWLDGWLDYAAGRDKYHLETCEKHGNAEGECGEG